MSTNINDMIEAMDNNNAIREDGFVPDLLKAAKPKVVTRNGVAYYATGKHSGKKVGSVRKKGVKSEGREWGTAADTAKSIATELKEQNGWTRNDVSITSQNYSQGSSVNITIKNLDVDYDTVKLVAKQGGDLPKSRTVFVGYSGSLEQASKNWIEGPIAQMEIGDSMQITPTLNITKVSGTAYSEFGYQIKDTARDVSDVTEDHDQLVHGISMNILRQKGEGVDFTITDSEGNTAMPLSTEDYNFVNYVESFYGADGIYDMGATRGEIQIAMRAVQEEHGKEGWGGGDSVDRERVRDELIENHGKVFPQDDAPSDPTPSKVIRPNFNTANTFSNDIANLNDAIQRKQSDVDSAKAYYDKHGEYSSGSSFDYDQDVAMLAEMKAHRGTLAKPPAKDAKSDPSRAQHGFDLGSIDPEHFNTVLDKIGASSTPSLEPVSNHSDDLKAFVWEGKDVTIVTMNNPITGEYAREGRGNEVGYASYVGIQGSDTGVMIASTLMSALGDWKDESHGARDFI